MCKTKYLKNLNMSNQPGKGHNAWHDISHSKNVTTCIVNVKINACNKRSIGVDLLQLWEIRIDECLQMWHGQVFLAIPPNVVSCLHLYFMFITCDPITKKCMLITGVNYYTTIYIYIMNIIKDMCEFDLLALIMLHFWILPLKQGLHCTTGKY